MSTVIVESSQNPNEALRLVRSAVKSEITRLELALKLADERLAPFEQKYGVKSEKFIAEMAAEDLAGGDDEYVQWAGEYQLKQRLQAKLQHLQQVKLR
jgi:hypothetical protein